MSLETHYDYSERKDEERSVREYHRGQEERHGGPGVMPSELRIESLERSVEAWKKDAARSYVAEQKARAWLWKVSRDPRTPLDLALEVQSLLLDDKEAA